MAELNLLRLPCPDCGAEIPLPLEGLLAGNPAFCPGCGVKMRLNADKSREGLAALRDLRQRMETIATADTSSTPSSDRRPSPSHRRPRRS